MKINSIYSNRNFERWPSWHIVHEWENDLASLLKVGFSKYSKLNLYFDGINGVLSRKIPYYNYIALKIDSKNIRQNKSLIFEMIPKKGFAISTSCNSIPIIIDFWISPEYLNNFYSIYRNCPVVLISSKEVYDHLIEYDCPLNIHHFPFWLPNKYFFSQSYDHIKYYDVVLAGRQNPVLLNYLYKYEKDNDLEYVYQDNVRGELFYISNKSGVIGKYNNREDYINLLLSSKVAFYATPGIDGGEKRTNGYNPVTPRFLELLSSGCHLLMRYPDNSDTKYYKLDSICPNIDSYTKFEKKLSRFLNMEQPLENKNNHYLSAHTAKSRVELLESIISKV